MKDIEVVKQKLNDLNDLIELWCVLNTCKGDESAKEIMDAISSVITKDALLKRWNELHPLKTDPTQLMTEYMEKRKKIISKLLV